MSDGTIYRITLFKIPSADDQSKLLDIYRGMPGKAVKVRFIPFPLLPSFPSYPT